MNALQFPLLYLRAVGARRQARARGVPDMRFADFGVDLGWRLLRKGERLGAAYVLTPVSIVRYLEFPAALSWLPDSAGKCLDVASPRLFSLFVASTGRASSIRLINPDLNDTARTRRIIELLDIHNVHPEASPVESIHGEAGSYEVAWSISVVEHIEGEWGDRVAMSIMFGSLRPGGRLIVTVPVDRTYRLEYRDHDVYGLHAADDRQTSFFFQRLYDERAIMERLIDRLAPERVELRWFGEVEPGTYASYEQQWLDQGFARTVVDPLEIANGYKEFSSWSEMPGMGVCALMLEKPA